jgi:hypothetical protein
MARNEPSRLAATIGSRRDILSPAIDILEPAFLAAVFICGWTTRGWRDRNPAHRALVGRAAFVVPSTDLARFLARSGPSFARELAAFPRIDWTGTGT